MNIANIMKKLVFLFFILFSFYGQSVFWKIESSQGKTVGYLYGTMHSNKPEVRQKAQKASEKLSETEVLFVELSPQDTKTAKTRIIKYLFVKDTSLSLSQALGEKKYQKMKKKIQRKYGINLDMFQTYQPIIINSMLLQKEFSEGNNAVVDMYISQKAKEKGISVEGLETPEEQIRALTGLPYQKQAEMLYEAVKKGKKKSSTNKLLKAYLKGDLEKMLKMSSEWEVSEEYKEALIDNRNKKMSKKIIEELNNGRKIFVAVGALHLPGKTGIIAQLKQAGYKVTPIIIK